MDPQLLIFYAVAAIAVIQLLVLVVLAAAIPKLVAKIGALSDRTETFLQGMQEELTATLQEAHTALVRVEELSQTTHRLLKEDVTPVFQSARSAASLAESAGKSVSDTLASVKKIAATVESVSSPTALAASAAQAMKTGKGRAGLMALGISAGVGAILGVQRKRAAAAAPVAADVSKNGDQPAEAVSEVD
jgi:hypothetical protein